MGPEERSCFMCSSPSVPFGFSVKDETNIFAYLCKLFEFPSPHKKQLSYRAVGNSEFCDSCILLVRDAMTLCSQIETLQNNLKRVKSRILEHICSSYEHSRKKSCGTTTSVDVTRGMLAQCWSKCSVVIPRLSEDIRPLVREKRRGKIRIRQDQQGDVSDSGNKGAFQCLDNDNSDNVSGDVETSPKKRRRAKKTNESPPVEAHHEGPLSAASGGRSDTNKSCSQRVPTEIYLECHTSVHEGEKPLWCKLCKTGFSGVRILIQHLTKVHENEDLTKCHNCGLDFNESRQDADAPYTCNLNDCGTLFSTLDEFRLHHISKCAVCPSQEIFQCAICSSSFLSNSDFQAHVCSGLQRETIKNSTSGEVTTVLQITENSVVYSHVPDTALEVTIEDEPDHGEIQETSSDHKAVVIESVETGVDGLFQCSYCPKRFKSEKARGSHTVVHSEEKPLWCKLCSTGFQKVRLLVQHITRIHRITDRSSCPLCESNLKETWNKNTNRYHCSLGNCHRTFSTLRNLRVHHIEKCADSSFYPEKPQPTFMCEKCGKSFSATQYLNTHVARCRGPASTGAESENNGGNKKERKKRAPELVSRASKKPSPDRPFACTVCWKWFRTEESLKLHSDIHLPKMSEFKCDQCDKVVQTRMALINHVATIHEKTFKFCCDQCGTGFQNASMLRRHIDFVHSTEKRFKCDLCDMRFKRSHQLLYHSRTHTGERPYMCEVCGKGFHVPHHLRVHMTLHKSNNQFPCSSCEKSFGTLHYLKYHIKYVHEGKSRRKREQTTQEDPDENADEIAARSLINMLIQRDEIIEGTSE